MTKTTPPTCEVTQLLAAWSHGDKAALDKLMSVIYDELRRLAHHYMTAERRDHPLQTTALVNEAYLRLAGQRQADWKNRAQFFGVAAHLMRRILVDQARNVRSLKRGGGVPTVSVEDAAVLSSEPSAGVIALSEALERLAVLDGRKSRVVELRYFGGLTVEETAEVLRVSSVTVQRDWSAARAWLRRELGDAT
jgi:RNA polymerase sigma factor (TIGR02999 family)